MTDRGIKYVLPDGTRVYHTYNRYKPKPVEERLIGINKPDDPRAVRFHTRWFLPLEVIPDEDREMPFTRSDDEILEHLETRFLCKCPVCKGPGFERMLRKWQYSKGLKVKPRSSS